MGGEGELEGIPPPELGACAFLDVGRVVHLGSQIEALGVVGQGAEGGDIVPIGIVVGFEVGPFGLESLFGEDILGLLEEA